jgi:hypothetical protein
MQDESSLLVTPSTDAAADRSLVEDVRQLAQDSKTLVEAELAYQKSRAAIAGVGAKGVVSAALLGIALVFFALVALTVGLLIALTPWLTALGATAAVTLGLLGGAALCGLIGRKRWKRIAMHFTGKEGGA